MRRNESAIFFILMSYVFAHGPPFERTDSSAECAAECIDTGFVFCQTDNSKIGTCRNPEEGAGSGECSLANQDTNAKYLFCPYEDVCEWKVAIAGNEKTVIQFDSDVNTPTSDSLCTYEIRFPENAAWGSRFSLEVSGLTGADLYFLTGREIQTAQGSGSGSYSGEAPFSKVISYPFNAYLTFKKNDQGEVAHPPFNITFQYVQATGPNLVTELGGPQEVIEEKSLQQVKQDEE